MRRTPCTKVWALARLQNINLDQRAAADSLCTVTKELSKRAIPQQGTRHCCFRSVHFRQKLRGLKLGASKHGKNRAASSRRARSIWETAARALCALVRQHGTIPLDLCVVPGSRALRRHLSLVNARRTDGERKKLRDVAAHPDERPDEHDSAIKYVCCPNIAAYPGPPLTATAKLCLDVQRCMRELPHEVICAGSGRRLATSVAAIRIRGAERVHATHGRW